MALYVLLSLIMLLVGDRVPQSFLRGVGATLFAPLDRVVMVADRVATAWSENRDLHTRLAKLEFENTRLRIQGVENRQLRQGLGLPGFADPALRPMEIVALSGEPWPVSATLGAGTGAGVHVGDIVVTSAGLVGRIAETYPFNSRVMLLTDPGAAVACEVESTGVLGVLRFSATPRPALTLTAVPYADTVHVGQRILTSGLSIRYPRGIPVGTIASVGKDPNGLTQAVQVELAARLTRLRHVFVIRGPAEVRP